MIARIFSRGASFNTTCEYIERQEAKSQLIDLYGVRGHDPEMMARDFELNRTLRSEVSKPVFHGVLDFHPNERLDDRQLRAIARKYLQGIGLTDTQYVAVKHSATSHMHVHLVANRIDIHGNPIDNFPEILNSRDVASRLVTEYELMPVGKKNLRQTNFDALDNRQTRLYAIYRCIHDNLPGCRHLEDLEERLKLSGVDVRYRMDGEKGKRIGISFRYMGEAFKGKQIDNEFSLPQLELRLSRQQKLTLWEQEKQALRMKQVLEETRELTLVKERKLQQVQKLEDEELKQTQRLVHRMRIR